MKCQDYIKLHALELKKLCDKRERLNARYFQEETASNRSKKISIELSFLGMYISMEKERLAFALGYLSPQEATKEYCVSEFHRYEGIRSELEKTTFDRE